jgi:hypothetical protein
MLPQDEIVARPGIYITEFQNAFVTKKLLREKTHNETDGRAQYTARSSLRSMVPVRPKTDCWQVSSEWNVP